MNKKSVLLKYIAPVSASMMLFSGCGSSGSDTAAYSAVAGSTQSGHFIDSAVGGVEYSCGGVAGITGSDGSFTCSSAPISFRIGALNLGAIFTVPSDGKLMPQDLAGVPRTDTTSNSVVNLACLLQSLDDDGNANNGIMISSATRAVYSTLTNVQSQNLADIQVLVEESGKGFVSASSAISHLRANTPELNPSPTPSPSPTPTPSPSPSPTPDTTPPNTPTLTTATPIYTNANSKTVELAGEAGASIFVNSVDTNQDMNSSAQAEIALDTSGSDGVKEFAITLKDAAGNESGALDVNITKDTVAPTTFSWVYGIESNSTSTLTNRRVSFDENITTTGISITLSNSGTASNIAVSENIVSFSYQKLRTDENVTIAGTDLAGNAFNITRGSGIVLKTGQTTSYVTNDDGSYQKGVARSYTRNDTDETVTDNTTGLIWQDNATPVIMNWTDAMTYCETLDFAGSTAWRLPTKKELLSITDLGKSNPAIDATFTNVVSDYYWSSSTYASNASAAWYVDFYFGNDYADAKTLTSYVRCVRDN